MLGTRISFVILGGFSLLLFYSFLLSSCFPHSPNRQHPSDSNKLQAHSPFPTAGVGDRSPLGDSFLLLGTDPLWVQKYLLLHSLFAVAGDTRWGVTSSSTFLPPHLVSGSSDYLLLGVSAMT